MLIYNINSNIIESFISIVIYTIFNTNSNII